MKLKKQISIILSLIIIILSLNLNSEMFSFKVKAEVVLGDLQYTLDVGTITGSVYCDVYSNDSGVTFSAVIRGNGTIASNKLPFGSGSTAIYNSSLMNIIFESGSSVGLSAYITFSNCTAVTYVDLSGYTSAKTINNSISNMFFGCSSVATIDNANNLITSNITNASNIFYGCSSLVEINGEESWDTSSITYAESMFKNCSKLQSISCESWNLNSIIRTNDMFYGCALLTCIELNSSTFSSLTSAKNMFYNCISLINEDISNWQTTVLTDVSAMFSGCQELISVNVSGLDTSNVTTMSFMFSGCKKLETIIGIDALDFTNVTNMSYMFNACTTLTSMEINFNTTKLTNVSNLFTNCSSLTSVTLNINTTSVTNVSNLFLNCTSLTEVYGEETWILNNVTNATNMFMNCKLLTEISAGTWGLSLCTTMYQAFYGCNALVDIDGTENWNLSNCTNLSGTFMYCFNMDIIDGTGWDLSKVTLMTQTFQFCCINDLLGEENWDLSAVTNMNSCFNNNSNSSKTRGLRELSVGSWGLQNVTTASYLFASSYALEVLSGEENWDLSKCTDLQYAFANCGVTEINVTGWNLISLIKAEGTFSSMPNLIEITGDSELTLTSITSAYKMFKGDTSLINIDLSSAGMNLCTNTSYMFSNCTNLVNVYGVENWNTPNLNNISYMFESCSNLIFVNFSNLITDAVTNITSLFNGCQKLLSIDMSNCNFQNVTSVNYVFNNCSSLKQIYTPTNLSLAVGITATPINYMKYNGVYTLLGTKQLPLNFGFSVEYLTASVVKMIYGDGFSDTYSEIVDGKIDNIDIPVKENFVFKGFNTASNGSGTEYIDSNGIYNTLLTITDGTILYAVWEPKIIEVQVPTHISVTIDGNTSSVYSDIIEIKNLSSMDILIDFHNFTATENSEISILSNTYWDPLGGWAVLNAEQTKMGVALRFNECNSFGNITSYGYYSGNAVNMLSISMLEDEIKYFKIDGLTGPAWATNTYFDFNLNMVISEK